jgi:glycosyltransferase involved in cell wall biosynthesis
VLEVRSPRVALVHHWLVTMRGGEKFLESLCDIFPDADIFTHVCRKEGLSPKLQRRTIKTSFIDGLPFSHRLYKSYLPLMPLATEMLDLRSYDIVISSDACTMKGVITAPSALHVCYCHSPMRYIWGMEDLYTSNRSWLTRRVFKLISHYMRIWDFMAAARVDEFTTNSTAVASRISKFYRRTATPIGGPVDCDLFHAAPAREDFYLFVGQLVGYKRADLAVAACRQLGRKLVVIGQGEHAERLRREGGENVTFLGSAPFDVLVDHYARCRALLFPGEEDFGLVPIEAMASGAPVIAYRAGGALDTVSEGVSGLFFDEPTTPSLVDAIRRFENGPPFEERDIIALARKHHIVVFQERFLHFINRCLIDRGCPPLRHLARTPEAAVA